MGLALLVAAAVGLLGLPPPAAPSAHAHANLGTHAHAHGHAHAHAPALADADADPRAAALLRLQEALGLPAPSFDGAAAAGAAAEGDGGDGGRRREAPEFMLELQRRVAHPDGVLREPPSKGSALPHGARIVRSFFEQEGAEAEQEEEQALELELERAAGGALLRFNVSRLDASERVLGAELRIFRLRRPRQPLLLRVHQVEPGRGHRADEHRLLGVQAASARAAPGWHAFNVLPAVRAWLAGDASNLGLLVTAGGLDGAPLPRPRALFARRGHGVARRQPLLVLYDAAPAPAPAPAPSANAHGRRTLPPVLSGNDVEEAYDDEEEEEDEEEGEGEEESYYDAEGDERGRGRRRRRDARRRRRRHGGAPTPASGRNATNTTGMTALERAAAEYASGVLCSKRNLWVEFSAIGWSHWIISPPGYNAYQCVGECPYPLGPALGPTNHATVQSIVHALGLHSDARPPCCAPDALQGLSLLFTNERGDVVLKIYEDMVAGTCGCQ